VATIAPAAPKTVTVNGAKLFNTLVHLLQAQDENGRDDPDLDETDYHLHNGICEIWGAAFGDMFRDCDLGTEAPNCKCDACNGYKEAATPLYRSALERAKAA
jgi:hypothetical protein